MQVILLYLLKQRYSNKIDLKYVLKSSYLNFLDNNDRPDTVWPATSHSMFSHPVHYGGSVFSGVSHYGTVETCSVITPSGENLVITNDVTYPHIQRIASNNVNFCNINFTNIDSSSIGKWAINGKFRLILGGLNEIHLPLRFFLYSKY